MGSTPLTTEMVVSPVGTLRGLSLETSIDIVVNDEREKNLDINHGDHSLLPSTPEKHRFQKDLQMFREAFDKNMENKPVKHDQCFVLLLSWDESIDDLGVKDEVGRLGAMFRDLYGFNVTSEKLGNREGSPKHQLNRYLATFMENHDRENTLLIIYYAGHGVYVKDEGVRWQPKVRQQTKLEKDRDTIAWSSAEQLIIPRDADVLVIFDCCEAGGYGDHQVPTRSLRPNFEFIAACGVNERTRLPGQQSFTSALMWALEELQPHSPFTSISLIEKAKLYEHLPRDQNPQLRRKDDLADGLVWMAPLLGGPEPEAIAKSEHRNPKHEYIDLRFNFYRRVEQADAENMAKELTKLIQEENSFAAKHITLLDVSSTFHRAVSIMRRSTNTSAKRKSISTPSICTRRHAPDHLGHAPLPPAKRQRHESVVVLRRDATEAHSALYHARMFFHYSLQTLGSGIGRVAERIRPTILIPEIATDSLSAVEWQ